MNRFIRDSALTSHPLPDTFNEEFTPLFPHQKVRGSLFDSAATTSSATCCLSIPDDVESHVLTMNGLSKTIEYSLPSVSTRHIFSDHDLTSIKDLYSRLLSH